MSNMAYSNNQLVLSSQISDKQNTTSELRIRTNIYSLTPINILVAEDNESVPHTFMQIMDKIRNAFGCKNILLAGYFSALCAVLPDLTKLAYEILKNLGFTVMEKVVSSRSTDFDYTSIHRFDYIDEVLSFAQLIYIPFTNNFEGIGRFWRNVAINAGIGHEIYLLKKSDAETLHSYLMRSGLIAQLRSEVYQAQLVLAATSPPFGLIFTEASKWVQVEERDGRRSRGQKTYLLTA